MFTGIVEKTGRLEKIENKNGKIYFTIKVANFLGKVKIGASIACDGVCLTVVKKTKDNFTVELMPETFRVTKFSKAKTGQAINLELAMKLGERLDGHFVSGHVDAVGAISKILKEGEYTCLEIKAPVEILKYLSYKGSVAINGVSLTIAGIRKNVLKVCLISHTLKMTNLGDLKIGDEVNLEVDLIARYLEKLISQK
ncbi:MAG: Riboflavin synthase, alpha subunit [Parcubacteria group bacterium GW2011_GWE2_39_37]|nr:MAG: Riboflavin synthase, alpha subunit [Parcubacteria group bacterium GW2011_GWE2_39_37]